MSLLKTKWAFSLVIAALSIIFLMLQKPEAVEKPAPVARELRTVGKWKGRGNKNTETFHIPSHEWLIIWRAKSWEHSGILGVGIHRPDGTPIDLPVCFMGPEGNDQTVIRGAGDYYLDIESGYMSWEVEVKAYYPVGE